MISIIIPIYNDEKYIVQCLDSILMQKTRYKFEVLVGEDCSTDNTLEICSELSEKDSRIRVISNEKNLKAA